MNHQSSKSFKFDHFKEIMVIRSTIFSIFLLFPNTANTTIK